LPSRHAMVETPPMARKRRPRLVTVLFTDIVGSSEIAVDVGDRRWKALLEAHHAIVRQALRRFGGRELDTAGDGFFAVFGGQEEAIRCACEIATGVREIGLEIRAGLHIGEAHEIEGKMGGVVVHAGARIAATGNAGDVIVSSVLHDLVPGARFAFEDLGMKALKGIPEEMRLWRVRSLDGFPLAATLDPVQAARRRELVPPARDRRIPLIVGGIVGIGTIAILVTVLALRDGKEPSGRRPIPPIPSKTLVRIDAGSMQIEDRFRLSDNALDIAYSEDRVWIMEKGILEVLGSSSTDMERIGLEFSPCALAATVDGVIVGDCEHHRLYRVDTDLHVSRWHDVPRFGDSFSVLHTDRDLWVLASRKDRSAEDRLYRLDPSSGEVLGWRRLADSRDDAFEFTEAGGAIWTFDFDDGRIIRISPTTLDVTEVESGSQPDSVASSEASVWVSDAGPGEVIQFDAANGDVVRRPPTYGLLTSGDHEVWVLDLDRLYRIDEEGTITGPLELPYVDGGHFGNPTAYGAGSVWIAVRPEDF
jgi:class 3 adenylate cyclase/streptogramin lyase